MAINIQERALAVLDTQGDLARQAAGTIRKQRHRIRILEGELERTERAVRDQALQIERLQQELAELRTSASVDQR